MTVEHQTNNKRFSVAEDGQVAYSEYIFLPDRVIFTHTEVPPSMEGKGLASQLARAGLEWAKSENKMVVPLCPFVAGYMARHPEWKELLAPGYHV